MCRTFYNFHRNSFRGDLRMSTIKELAIFFCAASVMCGAFSLLAGKALEKSFKYILALIFLSIMVSAVTNFDFSFKMPTISNVSTENEAALQLSGYQAEYLTGQLLKENGINFTRVEAFANKIEDGGIVINEINIYGATDVDKAREIICSLGICETVNFE